MLKSPNRATTPTYLLGEATWAFGLNSPSPHWILRGLPGPQAWMPPLCHPGKYLIKNPTCLLGLRLQAPPFCVKSVGATKSWGLFRPLTPAGLFIITRRNPRKQSCDSPTHAQSSETQHARHPVVKSSRRDTLILVDAKPSTVGPV